MSPQRMTPSVPSTFATRLLLAILTILLLASGELISKGAIYGLAFVGLIAWPTIILPHNSYGYSFLMIEFALLLPVAGLLLLGGLLIPLIGSIYITVRKKPSLLALTFVGLSLGTLAVLMTVGFLLTISLPEYPVWDREQRVKAYFFLWPLLLGVLALSYLRLYLRQKHSPTGISPGDRDP